MSFAHWVRTWEMVVRMRVVSSFSCRAAASVVRRVEVKLRCADSRSAFLRSRSVIFVFSCWMVSVCLSSVVRRVRRVRARDSRCSSSFCGWVLAGCRAEMEAEAEAEVEVEVEMEGS